MLRPAAGPLQLWRAPEPGQPLHSKRVCAILKKRNLAASTKPEGRYTEAYRRSGGILNLFTPPWGEQEDEVWAELLAGWQQTTFADEQSRQEALRALEQQWNTTPHPFFAGLTPEQVMVGGGRREAELAEEFLGHLTQMYDGQAFSSEGEMLSQTLMLLRGWQVQPRIQGQTP